MGLWTRGVRSQLHNKTSSLQHWISKVDPNGQKDVSNESDCKTGMIRIDSRCWEVFCGHEINGSRSEVAQDGTEEGINGIRGNPYMRARTALRSGVNTIGFRLAIYRLRDYGFD
jgi:hypothetical protein